MSSVKLLLCSASFAPSYGGPARSVSGLADALQRSGCEIAIWAPDNSALQNSFLTDNSPVQTLGGSLETALSEVGELDLIHDSGIWMPHNHAIAKHCRRYEIPRVVSVRGMLEPWAKRHKRVKKWLAWRAYQQADLRSADAIHVTGDTEARSIAEVGLRTPWLVPNGICLPPSLFSPSRGKRVEGLHKALFLGRLYPVKGLPMLIEAWSTLPANDWRLHIVGPDEAGHRAELERLIAKFGLQDVVEIQDAVDSSLKWKLMSEADLFVCPSHSENFGVAIAEAMACGTPVVTTTGTPWKAILDRRLGWWVKPSVNSISKAMREAIECSPTELRQMGLDARDYVTGKFTWDRVGGEMRDRYRELLTST
nr:glycosyltransferase [Rosistilla oblonga]